MYNWRRRTALNTKLLILMHLNFKENNNDRLFCCGPVIHSHPLAARAKLLSTEMLLAAFPVVTVNGVAVTWRDNVPM